MKLSVKGLRSFYGPAQILFDLDLELKQGEVAVLLGRNGAGKTTTFRSLMGLMPRVEGEILFDGQSIASLPPYEIARRGVGFVPEDRRIFSRLTVSENLSVGRQSPRANAPHWTTEKLFALFPNLEQMQDRFGQRMSGGEQQMLTIARTLMGNPSLILLDEPSEGIAPKILEQMIVAVRAMKLEGLSILVSEQNLHFARHIADTACIIEKGRVQFRGTLKELEENPQIRNAYLAV